MRKELMDNIGSCCGCAKSSEYFLLLFFLLPINNMPSKLCPAFCGAYRFVESGKKPCGFPLTAALLYVDTERIEQFRYGKNLERKAQFLGLSEIPSLSGYDKGCQ